MEWIFEQEWEWECKGEGVKKGEIQNVIEGLWVGVVSRKRGV
jgi:hypothetical protein